MIETGPTPDVFRIDFGKARRTRRPTLGQVLEGAFVRAAHPVVVDGHAIAQAICKVMDACTFADVPGRGGHARPRPALPAQRRGAPP